MVRDPATHLMVLEKILGVAWEIGLRPMGLTYSPVRGPEGNIEYLLFLSKEEGEPLVTAEDARLTVEQSHQELDH